MSVYRGLVLRISSAVKLEHGVQSGIAVPRTELAIEDEQTTMNVVQCGMQRFELLSCGGERRLRVGKLRREFRR